MAADCYAVSSRVQSPKRWFRQWTSAAHGRCLGVGFSFQSAPPVRAQRCEVRIRFTGWAARVVAERHWHASQSITLLKEDGSEIEFRAELAGLEEITRWVLGHGRHAEVLAPAKLRNAVQAEARAMLKS